MSAQTKSERGIRAEAQLSADAGGAAFAEAVSTASAADTELGAPVPPGSADAERVSGDETPETPCAGGTGEREGAFAPSRKAAPNTARAEKQSYSAEEVRAIAQSEADRRVTGAKKRWERELGERVESEAKRLADEQTSEYAERITALEGELAAERAASARRERRLAIDAALAAAGLPSALAPLVEGVAEGDESAAIEAIARAVDESAKAECARRVVMKAPAAPETKRTLTENEIRALPVARLAELMKG